jgi:hypothetical protein
MDTQNDNISQVGLVRRTKAGDSDCTHELKVMSNFDADVMHVQEGVRRKTQPGIEAPQCATFHFQLDLGL